ncbi:ATP-binding cassette domain-containing protein [uncultured Agathobaculum sp.]|uniref:ATP-binding cassette domain-containing protein n=1 Tax=uncultured Agathobaculum sp. TaxID=2048140 RepID=UPI00320B6590
MAYLELKNVGFAYPNGFQAVENVSMSFELGETVAIIGQNGAGKTTTVKLMNGLLRPTQGEVLVEGQSTKGFTTAQIARKVGYLEQPNVTQLCHALGYEKTFLTTDAFVAHLQK